MVYSVGRDNLKEFTGARKECTRSTADRHAFQVRHLAISQFAHISPTCMILATRRTKRVDFQASITNRTAQSIKLDMNSSSPISRDQRKASKGKVQEAQWPRTIMGCGVARQSPHPSVNFVQLCNHQVQNRGWS